MARKLTDEERQELDEFRADQEAKREWRAAYMRDYRKRVREEKEKNQRRRNG